jgi:hypothetical protein
MKVFERPKTRARPLALYFPIVDNAVSATGDMVWFWVHVIHNTWHVPCPPGYFVAWEDMGTQHDKVEKKN